MLSLYLGHHLTAQIGSFDGVNQSRVVSQPFYRTCIFGIKWRWDTCGIYPSNMHTVCHALVHYSNVIMGAIASQITSLTIVYSIVYWDADQRKHQSSASLAFVRGIHRGPMNSPHKWPATRKVFPFDDVIMLRINIDRFISDPNCIRNTNFEAIDCMAHVKYHLCIVFFCM